MIIISIVDATVFFVVYPSQAHSGQWCWADIQTVELQQSKKTCFVSTTTLCLESALLFGTCISFQWGLCLLCETFHNPLQWSTRSESLVSLLFILFCHPYTWCMGRSHENHREESETRGHTEMQSVSPLPGLISALRFQCSQTKSQSFSMFERIIDGKQMCPVIGCSEGRTFCCIWRWNWEAVLDGSRSETTSTQSSSPIFLFESLLEVFLKNRSEWPEYEGAD